MQAHAKEYGIEPIVEEVIGIDIEGKVKRLRPIRIHMNKTILLEWELLGEN